MAKIVPHEVHVNGAAYDWRKPFYVSIDGKVLTTHDHRTRYFKSEVDAVAAGMDHVTRTRQPPRQATGQEP